MFQLRSGNKKKRINRKLEVHPGGQQAIEIISELNELCPNLKGGFGLNQNEVTANKNSCKDAVKKYNLGCACTCEIVNDPNRTIEIKVVNISNSPKNNITLHDGTVVPSLPFPSAGPGTSPSFNRVTMPEKSSTMFFGAFDGKDSSFIAPESRMLAHELCGHAWKKIGYSGTKGNRPQHDNTIRIENVIVNERGLGRQRGLMMMM